MCIGYVKWSAISLKYHHYYVQNTLDRQQKRKDRLKEGLAKLRIIDTTVPLKVQCHKIFCHWTCHESFFFHFGLVFTEFLKLKNWKKPLWNCKKSTSFLITFSGGVINISWHSLFNNMSADQGPLDTLSLTTCQPTRDPNSCRKKSCDTASSNHSVGFCCKSISNIQGPNFTPSEFFA